jgi:hypothetical protein
LLLHSTLIAPLFRIRLPRHFAPNGVLVPYSHDRAYRQFAIASVEDARYKDEQCCCHAVTEGILYLATDRRVLCVYADNLELIWKISYKSK